MNVSECPPVLLIAFNRPDLTRQTLERIASCRPTQLFVAIDGPRPGSDTDASQIQATRSLFDNLDWSCRLELRCLQENVGCRKAVTDAVSWFFERVERGIILEDDCLPNAGFFRFCQELLEHWADEPRVMSISGTNLVSGTVGSGSTHGDGSSYIFSRFQQVWGWATWRERWEQFRDDQACLELARQQTAISTELGQRATDIWLNQMQRTIDGEIDTWDYLWLMSCWAKEGFAIIPGVNLVRNIGFDHRATHTHDRSAKGANLEVQELDFPLGHPESIQVSRYDREVLKQFHQIDSGGSAGRIMNARFRRWLTRFGRHHAG